MRGLVIRSQSGFYTVKTETGPLVCRLRGRLKQGPWEGEVVAVGDWVEVRPVEEKTGTVEAVEPRERMLYRMAPTPRGETLQIILANLDQAVFVFACSRPEPHLGMLDRFLVIAEKQGFPALVVANKVDLIGLKAAHEIFDHYGGLGYPVIYTSIKTGQGVNTLRRRLAGKISALAGPSGVGKSSLLNAVQPGLGLQVREVSRASHKGQHTTVVRELFPLAGGGYVADTPGLKALALYDIEPEELDGYFPELRERVTECYFSNCTHINEPGCAVLGALEAGLIHPTRYQSYVSMRSGEQQE